MNKSAVEVYDKPPYWQTPVSGTVGRVNALLPAAVLLSREHTQPGPTKPELEDLTKYYEDDNDDIPLAVYAAHERPINQLKRIWTRKKLSVPGKVLGTLSLPASTVSSAVGRADHYNPLAHSVTSWTNDPAIQAHELGHAEDFRDQKFKTLYTLSNANPINLMRTEARASKNAIPMLRKYLEQRDDLTPEEKVKLFNYANSKLTGAYGTYTAGAAGFLASVLTGNPLPAAAMPVAALAGRGLGKVTEPWGRPEKGGKGPLGRANAKRKAKKEEKKKEKEKMKEDEELSKEAMNRRKLLHPRNLAALAAAPRSKRNLLEEFTENTKGLSDRVGDIASDAKSSKGLIRQKPTRRQFFEDSVTPAIGGKGRIAKVPHDAVKGSFKATQQGSGAIGRLLEFLQGLAG